MMASDDSLTLSPLANSPVNQEEEEEEVPETTEEELRNETLSSETQCNLCQRTYDQPRVLSCLHFFCESCLEKLLNESNGENGHASPKANSILCPDCGQETKINCTKGVQGLPLDYVLCNQLEMSAIESMLIVCTSCKAKEKAVARCSDCANFLCPNCVTAHQFMRCFENHKVVTFEEMKISKQNAEAGDGESNNDNSKVVAIHKPITCGTHPGEPMKYFCFTCQIPVCNECLVTEHTQPEHRYERAADAEPKQREELENLMAESRGKVDFCEEATNMLQSSLSDLEQQRDDAKSLVQETFQSYKAVLERQLEKMLEELEEIHSRQELRIMDTFQSVEKTIEKIDDACKFSERLLKHGNTIEVLSLKNLVGSQLLYLINNTPKPDLNVEIRFESDSSKFEEAVCKYFGILKQKSHNQQPPSTLSPTESTESTSVSMFGLLNNTNSSNHRMNANGHHNYNQHHQGAASPLHSTSSFDSDHFALPVGVLSPDSGSVPSLDMDLTNNVVAQYNLTQLANMAAESNSPHDVNDGNGSIVGGGRATPGSPPMHASSTSIILSDLLTCTDDMTAQINAFNNLSVLANMGSVSLSGLTSLESVVGQQQQSRNSSGTQPIVSMRNIQQSPIDSALGALLNGGNGSVGNTSNTPQRMSSPGMESPILNGVNLNLGISRGVTPTSGQSSSCGGYNPPPRNATAKLNTMQIRCKFGQLGPGKSQFSSPHGFCLGLEEEIIVADTNNHRIQVFDKVGEFKLQFGVPGKEEGQLWYPRKVAVIRKTGKFVICDRGNERSRMQIFTKTGHFIKKIAIRYIDIVAGLAITGDGHIVAVDSVSPTVFVIAETGDLLHWFDCSEYMREPSDIAISNKEYYICDFKGHCVIVFNEEGNFLRRIGCENITNFPNGIDISDAGDVLVGDSHGNRFHVVVFSREGSILSEFECPYVKVSRCCGLKITSEGYIVTLAKNNHHVLILNTLYIM